MLLLKLTAPANALPAITELEATQTDTAFIALFNLQAFRVKVTITQHVVK